MRSHKPYNEKENDMSKEEIRERDEHHAKGEGAVYGDGKGNVFYRTPDGKVRKLEPSHNEKLI